jgi:hypothetical protein
MKGIPHYQVQGVGKHSLFAPHEVEFEVQIGCFKASGIIAAGLSVV